MNQENASMCTSEILKLIHFESRLLDLMELDQWLELYAKDARYWVPINENSNPEIDSSIIYDDHYRLEMRVEQLMRQKRIAQTPQSQTIRLISNATIELSDPDVAHITCILLVIETRSGDWRQRGLGVMNHYPSHCEFECIRQDGDWKIRSKKVILLQRHQPIKGLSFLL